jgi:E3 ubiquitin-protein ligase HUWE1
MRFVERHRRLLNAYVRRSPALLESSMAPLLRCPKLIEFDNKKVRGGMPSS